MTTTTERSWRLVAREQFEEFGRYDSLLSPDDCEGVFKAWVLRLYQSGATVADLLFITKGEQVAKLRRWWCEYDRSIK